MFSWCDALGSLPTVGLRLDPHYATSDALLSCFLPVLNTLTEKNKALFSVEKVDQFGMSFTSNEGYQYTANAFQVAVAFVHRLKLKTSDEGKPFSDLISLPLPFSELLPEVAKRATSAALRLPMLRQRRFDRVGVISTTTVPFDKAPPGICAFIDYLAKPWDGEAEDLNVRILGNLEKRPGSRDRCFHTLARAENAEQDTLTVILDWQRTFDDGKAITRGNLDEAVTAAILDASAYFESLGEGGRFDD